MRKPHNYSGLSQGYGAFVCDITNDNIFSQFQYMEIQVHPTKVRIDTVWNGQKLWSDWFTDETVLNLCRGLCNGGDHVGQLADAIDECGGNAQIANYLRKCAVVLAKYFQELSLTQPK